MGSHRSLVPVEKPEHIRDVHVTNVTKDFWENCASRSSSWKPDEIPQDIYMQIPKFSFLYLWAELLGLDEANPAPYEA